MDPAQRSADEESVRGSSSSAAASSAPASGSAPASSSERGSSASGRGALQIGASGSSAEEEVVSSEERVSSEESASRLASSEERSSEASSRSSEGEHRAPAASTSSSDDEEDRRHDGDDEDHPRREGEEHDHLEDQQELLPPMAMIHNVEGQHRAERLHIEGQHRAEGQQKSGVSIPKTKKKEMTGLRLLRIPPVEFADQVRIVRIEPGTWAASETSLLPGDILVELNGMPVAFMERVLFLEALTRNMPGEEYQVFTFCRLMRPGVPRPDDRNVTILDHDFDYDRFVLGGSAGVGGRVEEDDIDDSTLWFSPDKDMRAQLILQANSKMQEMVGATMWSG